MTPTLTFIDNFDRFTKINQTICSALRNYDYAFMPPEEFKNLFSSNLGLANKIYVQELLFRAHWAALTTILRNQKWMHGMDAAMKHPNYFSFCACLRGLLESAADSHDALRIVAPTLAKNYAKFAEALTSNLTKGFITCTELEDTLIHYTHGRKIQKAEQAPDSHKTKSVQDYLLTLEETGSQSVRILYGELCEITHPAASTVHIFVKQKTVTQDEFFLQNFDDMGFITGLLMRHNAIFPVIFQKSFNAALLSLYALNQFVDRRVFTEGMANINLSPVPAFTHLRETFGSQSKFAS